MPIYKANGKTYNIPEDKISKFESAYPDATVDVYDSATGKGYEIPVSKVAGFKKKFPGWSYDNEAVTSSASDAPIDNPILKDNPLLRERAKEIPDSLNFTVPHTPAPTDGADIDTTLPSDAMDAAGKGETAWNPTPLQKALKMEDIYSGVDSTLESMQRSVDNTRRLVESQTEKGRNRRKAADMRARISGTPTKVLGLTPNVSPATDGATGTTPKSNTNPNSPVVHGVKYKDGVAKTEWMLPDGSLSTSFIDADKAEYGARQARLQYEFIKRMEQNGLDPAKNYDVEKQKQKDLLDTAEKQTRIRLADNEKNLHELYDKRAKSLDEQGEWNDDEGFWSNFVRIVGGAANRSVTANAPRPKQSMTAEDKSIGTYLTENQVLTDAKKLLETRKLDKSDGFMGGFWKIGNNWRNMMMGARHALSDADLYVGGVMALQKATQLMDVEEKLKQGADLTDAEVSLVYSTMLGQDVRDNIKTPHGYNAAQITVEMFPFMAQMVLNPASGLSRAMVTKFGKAGLRKIAVRKAAQGLTGEASEAFAKKEMRKLTAKTVGVQVLGDMAEATVLANTLQAPKTAANAIERYQGDVVGDDKGDLSFDGNHKWGEAIYKAEASAIIENYTEMLGEHFGIIGNAIGKGAGKGLRAVGGGKVVDAVSDMVGKIGSTEWAKAIGEVEKRAHWNGTVGEVLEEEAGIVLNSIFTGDNKISDLWDADQQIDIVLGVGLFGGFVSGIKSVGYPIAKSRAKGNLRKRNSVGSWRFGDEWEGIRADIENADEKDLGTIIRDLVRSHAKSEEQGKAIVEYAHALMNARGYEIASASVRSDGNITPEQEDIEDSFEHGEQLAGGEDTQAMNDVKREMERARQKFVNSSSEDFVAEHFDGPDAVGNLLNLGTDPELRQTAVDYVNAKMVYDGMIQRVRDDVDGRIAQSDAMIDSRVNRETGMILPATMKIDDRKVYIVNGTVSMYEDGTGVDSKNSSESIIIRDAETGKVEFADPKQFINVDEAIDAETEKEAARKQIIDEVAVAAANNIDGVLSFNPGDTYPILDTEGNLQSVSVLGKTADENGVPAEGYVDVQFPDGSIEAIATLDLQQRVDAANAQRVEQFDQERSAQRAAAEEAARQADQSGLSNPNRRTDLMPDDYKMPYDNRPVRATRYIESENGTGGTLYQDENGNDAVVIAAIDDNNYVGYFREYDEQGNPTNRWSAKFQNGSGLRENHRDMMLTAQELLPAGHELTEHTSVSTDGLRNLANQLKHGYELQHDEQGNIVTTEVAVNMMARENELGLSDYEPGSIDPARVTSEEYKEAAARLIPYMEALGLSKFNIHWEDGTLYVDHPILKRADTPQQEVEPAVTENAETVPNSAGNTEIPTENRDLGTETVPKTEIPVENVQQAADDGFIPIDPNIKPDENGEIIIPSTGTAEVDAMSAAEEPKSSALSQIPTNEKGEPIYEQVDADLAWDGLLEETEDEKIAQNVIMQEIEEREDALKKISKQKPKAGLSTSQKIQAEKDKKKIMDGIQQSIDHWKRMAGTKQRRQAEEDAIRSAEMRKRAEEARVKAEQERAEREEAERIEREALNGVPDWSHDTPQDARARGYRRNGPQKVDRQENVASVQGKEVEVKFGENELPKGHAAVIDATALQPSHIQGSRNPVHFLDEAQPKERDDAASIDAAMKIASNIRPEEITSSVTAYTGAPTVNLRGETIQGNSRSDALRLMYESEPEQASKYKQYLIDHAADYGLTPEQIETVEHPVLVNMLDVADDEAIRLGQFVAQDTESGGIERIKSKNAVQKMGNEMGSFTNILLRSANEEDSVSQLIDSNGAETLKWMAAKGHISQTQYQSAFDSRGNLTEEAKNDLKGMLYENVFTGGSTRLGEMFQRMPAKAQRAILAVAHRDHDSNPDDGIKDELQQSIIAFNEMMDYPDVANATNLESAVRGVDSWSRQYAFDDVSGESHLPSEKYSNFALRLAAIYKGGSQKFIQDTFNDLFDTIQGNAQDTLFEEADKEPKTLAEAIRKVLEIDYKPLNINRDEDSRGDAVDFNYPQSETGGSGGVGNAEIGEREPDSAEPADSGAGTFQYRGERDDVASFPDSEFTPEEQEAAIQAEEYALNSHIEVKDDDWTEGGGYTPTLKRTVVIDGTHNVTQVDAPNDKGDYTGSIFEYDGKTFGDLREVISHIDNSQPATIGKQIAEAEAEVNIAPSDKQKEAGNYKKGHVQVGAFDVTIENPKGSKRSGTDADGKKWETTMTHTYGYIRGTKGVDGDHIDVFISSEVDDWNGRKVFVVDQYNPDDSFDEHKVMLGFNDRDEAYSAYLSNYEKDWENGRRLDCTEVNLEDFEKWIESSKRKTKAFAEYKRVRTTCPVCGKAHIPDYKSNDVTCPQCGTDLSVFRQIDQLSDEDAAQTLANIEQIEKENTKRPVYDRTVPATPEAQRKAITRIIDFAKSVKNRVERAVIGGITKRQAKDFAENGIDVDETWVHSFESSAIAHNQKHHGSEKAEAGRGQIAITADDYARIPEILEEYDKVSKSPNKTKGTENEVIIYEKEFGDGYIYYLEEKRDNRKSLAFHTMYKKKKGTDSSDGFAVEPTAPITPLATPDNLSSNSDGKDNALLLDKQGKEAESSDGYTITPTTYTNKKGKTSDVWLVKFDRDLSKEEKAALDTFTREPLTEGKKTSRGWYDRKDGSYMMRSEEAAKELAGMLDKTESATDGATAQEPLTHDRWAGMDGKARLWVSSRDMLTREEIENSNLDEVIKDNAIAFINGKRGFIPECSYLNAYENVRFTDRDSSENSGGENTTQLAGTDNVGGDRRKEGRRDGRISEPLDRGSIPANVSGEGIDRTDSERGIDSHIGKKGSGIVSEASSGVDRDTSRGVGRERGREDRGTRSDGRAGGRTGGHLDFGNDGGRDAQAGSREAGTVASEEKDADTLLNEGLEEFKTLLEEFKRAGQNDLSISVIGMSARQLELLPRLIAAGAKVGYALLRKGMTAFSGWRKNMRDHFVLPLRNAGLTDSEIEEWIREMWDCHYTVDGITRKVSDWASVIGHDSLRVTVGQTLADKRKAQRDAEDIEVVTGDIGNIRATLPFLLPQQQEDVLRAETQFFDESHSDREHAYGKGYMFTNGTGTGKTYTGLGIVKRFVKQGKGRVLILTPSQTKVKDWINDASNLSLELQSLDDVAKKNGKTATTVKGSGVVITTYANFRQNQTLLEDEFDLIVYDESHRLLENKKGEASIGSMQHYMSSNRNENYAFERLRRINPVSQELERQQKEFQEEYDSIVKKAKKEGRTDNIFHLKANGKIPPFASEQWNMGDEARFPKLAEKLKSIKALRKQYDEVEKPKIEKAAKEAVSKTKVVFLSATPFNTRDNLDYAEGYIFSYPKDDNGRQSPRSRFFLEHFGSAYKYRYNRLENSATNPQAVTRQEIAFSDYLQDTLQTMSGRVIDSQWDYSRDFPTVTGEYAQRFNEAMEELQRDESTRGGVWAVMRDHNYTSALFESLKVSQIIPRLKSHIEMGRKVVVFHRRVETQQPLAVPFRSIFDSSLAIAKETRDSEKRKAMLAGIRRLERKYSDMLEWERTLDLRMPREQLADAFGKDSVLFFSGKETSKNKNKAVEEFNDDNSGKNLIVIQEASGKEGISLHDRTGVHQRVLVTLALPQSPITALQIEGRIFRIGNKSNAIFEYPLLGLNTEMTLFGQSFNSQVGTTENLALGSKARDLRESFARGVEEHSGDVDLERQGIGGKEFDAAGKDEVDEFDRAVLDYYSNQNLNGRRDNREGKDYYPTPEPLGYVMARWGRIEDGESVLEPSAGHGAIARYVPFGAQLTAVEPSSALFSRLQLKAGGIGRKFENDIFENYHIVNKHDVVLMNPPFGTAGKLAVDHVAKAFSHLEEGGRVVALIPRGSTDKKFEKWYNETKAATMVGEVQLPDITFERAGTSVRCRVVVLDKISNPKLAQKTSADAVRIDLSGEYAKIEDFFDDLRDIEMPQRTIDTKSIVRKKCAVAARDIREISGVTDVHVEDGRMTIKGRRYLWASLKWDDLSDKELKDSLLNQFKRFSERYESAVKRDDALEVAVFDELRILSAKLAGVTVDEAERQFGNEEREEEGSVRYHLEDDVAGLSNLDEERRGEVQDYISRYNSAPVHAISSEEEIESLGLPIEAKEELQELFSDGDTAAAYCNYDKKIYIFAKQGAGIPLGEVLLHENVHAIVDRLGDDCKDFLKSFEASVSRLPHKSGVYGKALRMIEDSYPEESVSEEFLAYVVQWTMRDPRSRAWISDGLDEKTKDYLNKKIFNYLYGESRGEEREEDEARGASERSGAGNDEQAVRRVGGKPGWREEAGDRLERGGNGAYSDAEVSMQNDPWSKAWGESIRTKRKQEEFAERERNRMRERAKSLSSVLGVYIEVVEDASTLKGKKQRAKGWYDTKTGKITVVVSNHNSASDMEATILHEAVAHHGLRQLLGKHFDEFLDKVYEAAENGIKEQIDLLASRNGWDRRVATEEYLAGLAERTDFDRAEERVGGWFDKIKRLFFDMLFKAGFKHISPGSIGDNELRYILWRSYQNLANPGRYRAFEWEAEDVAMQYKLQVGEYDATSNNAITAADSDIRFRDGDFTPRDRALAALQYEHMLSRGSWQFREATQDSMLGLKTLYESILGSNLHIENVAGYENAYLYENRMSSANNGEQHQYFSRFMKPLLESIHKLCGSKELDRRILTDYMMAKHGLERNEYMRNEAAANGEDTKRDFAGLCGLTGEDDWQVAETVAQQMVDDYEADHNTTELWDNVQKATNATLEKIYLSGLISEDTYNKVLGMYDFYIPLRGWDETTSDEVYGYLTSKDGPLMGSVFKTAEGRDSKADDPIATIAMMADDAIRQGNRNIMKQRFLNFVHGNPSDLVSVNEMWLQHNDVTDEWEPVFADLQPNMTHAEVESEIAKFEAKMEALRTAEPDKYKKGGDARNIPYKVVRGNLNEHQVLVKRNGRTYVITINGNPRAAQALNGLTNPNVEVGGVIGDLLKLGEYVNRHLSAFYTTRNPDFVVSNFMRDMLYSNCMTWVKENPRYALRFHKNFGKVNPLTLRRLLSKWENDNLSDSNYLEKMFKEFMLNGGETGYTSVKDIEGHKRTIAKELKKLNKRDVGNKAWRWLGGKLDLLNRSAENCTRFAAFLTSREMGRTLDRSIHDAKEVSVNFNKKGSGGKFVHANGQKLLGKIGSYLGGGGRIAFVFWNAGIQGMTNFGRAGKRNPGKAIGGAAALFTLGYVIPLLAQMLGGGDGDDDDKNAYYNLPEYVRRSNICFKAGEQWITIPLPIEYRAIYGMGELACGVISGNERYSNSELAYYMAAQISQTLPLDFLEGANPTSHDGFNIKSISHPFIPSAFKPFTEAYIMNKGWTGLPVYKDTPYNKNDPEWTKAYQSADQHLVAFTRWLNETSGGDDYKKGAIDINPAKLEYLLSGTFGGAVSTTGKLKKMGETALGTREFEWRNMLLANRVIKSGDERTANRKLQNEYFKYMNEYEETNRLRKKYENAADDGILGYAERADFLYNSPEYLRFGIFEKYKPDIDAIREEIKEETNPEAKKELQEELFSTMRELVDELHDVGK